MTVKRRKISYAVVLAFGLLVGVVPAHAQEPGCAAAGELCGVTRLLGAGTTTVDLSRDVIVRIENAGIAGDRSPSVEVPAVGAFSGLLITEVTGRARPATVLVGSVQRTGTSRFGTIKATEVASVAGGLVLPRGRYHLSAVGSVDSLITLRFPELSGMATARLQDSKALLFTERPTAPAQVYAAASPTQRLEARGVAYQMLEVAGDEHVAGVYNLCFYGSQGPTGPLGATPGCVEASANDLAPVVAVGGEHLVRREAITFGLAAGNYAQGADYQAASRPRDVRFTSVFIPSA